MDALITTRSENLASAVARLNRPKLPFGIVPDYSRVTHAITGKIDRFCWPVLNHDVSDFSSPRLTGSINPLVPVLISCQYRG